MSRVEHIGRATLIYALSDESDCVRYVGKTVRSLGKRLGQHRREALRRELPVNRWVRKHHVSIGLLETVAPGGDWAARERFWIAELGKENKLLNLTVGGEGLAGLPKSPEHRAKISIALRMGGTFNCLTCGAEFYRKPFAIRHGENKFCSRDCSNRRAK